MIKPVWRLIITLAVILIWVIVNGVYFQTTALPGMGIRYLALPIVLLAGLMLVGVRYVQASYDLIKWNDALTYYLACMFGRGYPLLVVGDGKAQVAPGVENLLLKIGGPGYVYVRPGSVVLIEDYSGKVRVVGAGSHFISRLEGIKEIHSLEERHARIDRISATSKDGLEVAAQDIQYRYRVYSDLEPTANKPPINLLSYTDEAVMRMTYNRPVTSSGITDWHSCVNQVVESLISEFIRRHPVDYLIAPKTQGSEAREELYREFFSPAGIRRFHDKGAELVWIDIGHFETPDKAVIDQRVNTWQARWLGNANVLKAYGASQRAAYIDLARAEGQAEMLMSIIHGLEGVAAEGEPKINLRALYLARLTELLEAMSSQPQLSSETPSE